MAAAPFGVLRPDDVVTAAEAAAAALGSSTARDWTVPAGTLEWDVRTTLAHAAGATAKYALCLASGTSRFIALRSEQYADATNDDLLHALVSTARALRQVAVAVPDGRRAFHVAGMADAEGFVAMGCTEILVHAHDAASGVGAAFDPPDDLCRTAVSRLFPWTPADTPGWATLLWASGRRALEAHPAPGDDWEWHCAPLDEWDGTVPKAPMELPRAWRFDDSRRRWQPVTAPG